MPQKSENAKAVVSNPYGPKTAYHTIFTRLVEDPPTTKKNLIEYFMKASGKDRKHANYDVAVVISPKENSLGSTSAHGKKYYIVTDPNNRMLRVMPRNTPIIGQQKPNKREDEKTMGKTPKVNDNKESDITKRVRSILRNLEHVREDLMELSEGIWKSIDHDDTPVMMKGVDLKAQYNKKRTDFDRLAGELSALVQSLTCVNVEGEQPAADKQTTASRERIIQDLDLHKSHTLDEDFTYKRPYGFTLGEDAHNDVVTWRRLYELLCRSLERIDANRFKQLPDNPAFITNRDNPKFSRTPGKLRGARELSGDIFAEVNLSANHIRDQIKMLLKEFSIDISALRIYLRQDRDAED
jgi:hypothetical protein